MLLLDQNELPPIEPEKFLCSDFIKIKMELMNKYNKVKHTSTIIYRKHEIAYDSIIKFVTDSIVKEQNTCVERIFDPNCDKGLLTHSLAVALCLEAIFIVIKGDFELLCNLSYYELFQKENNIISYNSNRVNIIFERMNYDFIHGCFYKKQLEENKGD